MKPSYLLIPIFLFSFTGVPFAQKSTAFFITKEGNVALKKYQEEYKRVIEKRNKVYTITDYYLSGEVFMVAKCSDDRPITFNGNCTYYFKNGRIKMTGYFSNNRQRGTWNYYTENGNDSMVVSIDKNGKRDEIINTLKPTEDNVYKTNNSDFPAVENPAEYPGGRAAMVKFISKNFVYPKEAQSRSLEAKIFGLFEIDKSGSVVNIKTYSIYGFGMEEAVEKILQIMPSWNPAKIEGRIVKQKIKLPINFLLEKN